MPSCTTHDGSLPRSQTVVDFLFTRDRSATRDTVAVNACMADTMMEKLRIRKEPGMDIVADGECSKISYAAYLKDRNTGFSGASPRNAPADLKLIPGLPERLAESGGTPTCARPRCTGPVESKGQDALKRDIANLQAAIDAHGVELGA